MVCARLGFHCRVNGASWRGATGRMTVWVWAAARDGISRIQSTPGWSAQRMAARSVSASSMAGGATRAASSAWRWARAQAGNRASGAVPSTSWPSSDSAMVSRLARRWPGRRPTSSGSAQSTSAATPAGSDRAAGEGHVDVAGNDSVEEVGQPHPPQFDGHLWCFGGEQADQVWGEHRGGGRGDAQPHGACLAASDAPYSGPGGGDLVENDLRAGEQFGAGAGDGNLAGGAGE